MAMNDVPIWSIVENMLTENAIYWEVISVKSCHMDLKVKLSNKRVLPRNATITDHPRYPKEKTKNADSHTIVKTQFK